MGFSSYGHILICALDFLCEHFFICQFFALMPIISTKKMFARNRVISWYHEEEEEDKEVSHCDRTRSYLRQNQVSYWDKSKSDPATNPSVKLEQIPWWDKGGRWGPEQGSSGEDTNNPQTFVWLFLLPWNYHSRKTAKLNPCFTEVYTDSTCCWHV